MMALNLTAIHFLSSRVRDTFLIAHLDEPEKWGPGDMTFDLLSYYGFGSGVFGEQEGEAPHLAQNMTFFELGRTAEECMDNFFALVLHCGQKDIYFDPHDLRIFTSMVSHCFRRPLSPTITAKMLDRHGTFATQHPRSDMFSLNTGITAVEIDAKGPLVCFGVPDGIPGPEGITKFNLDEDNYRFDWVHCGQTGSIERATDILDALSALRYSSSTEEERQRETKHLSDNLNRLRSVR